MRIECQISIDLSIGIKIVIGKGEPNETDSS